MSEELVENFESLIPSSPDQRMEIVHVTKGALIDLVNQNGELKTQVLDMKEIVLDFIKENRELKERLNKYEN